MSNKNGAEVAAEFYIDSGKAIELKAQAAAYIKKTGGYINPATDDLEKDSAVKVVTVSSIAILGFALSSILFWREELASLHSYLSSNANKYTITISLSAHIESNLI